MKDPGKSKRNRPEKESSMSKPKSSASLAFRLNAQLFFRQLITFILLDLLLCALFLSAGLYLTDNRCLELAASIKKDPAAAASLPAAGGYQAGYQAPLPQGQPLFPALDRVWALWSADPSARRYIRFDEAAPGIAQRLGTVEYILAVGPVSGTAGDTAGLTENPAAGQAGTESEGGLAGAGRAGTEKGYLVITAARGRELSLFWSCLTAVLLWQGLSLFFFLLRNIRYVSSTLRPLRELTATTQALSAGGKLSPAALKNITGALDSITASHLDARIPLNRVSNELKPLAEAINEMLARIDEAYRSQMRFVSDASHELRTPIAVIQGYANLLTRWGTEDPETLQESIQAIKGEADSMKEMVEQLLFLARGDNDSMHLVWERLDLAEIGEEVLREIRMIDSRHQFVSGINAPALIEGDAGLMKQLMRILVDNSIKYTPEGGRIYLGIQTLPGISAPRQEAGTEKTGTPGADKTGLPVKSAAASPGKAPFRQRPAAGGQVLLKVQDEGVGIPPESLPHIFDRFYRADESRARNTGGTGLGLSIAQWIIERHGGFAEVTSREGLGTRFIIHLPAEQPKS